MKLIYKLVILSILVFAVGCSSVPQRMGAIQGKDYEVLGRAKSTAGGIMLLSLIPIGHNSKINRAYSDAVEQLEGDDLINPTIAESWYWAWVLNGYKVTIEGDVIKYKN
jgi:hypothetical protein